MNTPTVKMSDADRVAFHRSKYNNRPRYQANRKWCIWFQAIRASDGEKVIVRTGGWGRSWKAAVRWAIRRYLGHGPYQYRAITYVHNGINKNYLPPQ